MRPAYPVLGIALLGALCAGAAHGAESARLSKERYLDKCKGAWAGQMIGVCYGAPYEFRFNGRTVDEPIPPWKPERVDGAIGQDDCFVEMTWLMALEKHGLDITFAQAGQAFAESKYSLAHANRYGRENVRRGIAPPLSGHPLFNRHADDIDFQIEADLLGIICPGMPRESNRLAEVFGHIMNYGDGVYGGMFVAGMYAAAYFEDHDVKKVLSAGLACIPEQSKYHQCLSDAIRWQAENPGDWRATWKKIEEKWQDDEDCWPGDGFNIDAKINGAYIAVALLYGEGDPVKTMDIATRCGQDADCGASSALGILACMKGYAALGEQLTGGIPAIADRKFSFTDYSFKTLIPACQRMTEKVIERVEGEITDEAYLIPLQKPRPPTTLEQWVDQKETLAIPIARWELDMWSPGWRVVACGHSMEPGYRPEHRGRKNVIALHPVSEKEPAIIETQLQVPPGVSNPQLVVEAASHENGDTTLKIHVNGRMMKEAPIDTKGDWMTLSVPISARPGEKVKVRLEHAASGWCCELLHLGKVEIKGS